MAQLLHFFLYGIFLAFAIILHGCGDGASTGAGDPIVLERGANVSTQWRLAAGGILDVMNATFKEMQMVLTMTNSSDAGFKSAKDMMVEVYTRSRRGTADLATYHIPDLTRRFNLTFTAIEPCASEKLNSTWYTREALNSCVDDGLEALSMARQFVLSVHNTTATTTLPYYDSSASFGSGPSSASFNSLASQHNGSGAGDTSSSQESLGFKASGSSGSYQQVWQWCALSALICCCCITLALTMSSPRKKGSKIKETRSRENVKKDTEQKAGKDSRNKDASDAPRTRSLASSDLQGDPEAQTEFVPALPPVVPVVASEPVANGKPRAGPSRTSSNMSTNGQPKADSLQVSEEKRPVLVEPSPILPSSDLGDSRLPMALLPSTTITPLLTPVLSPIRSTALVNTTAVASAPMLAVASPYVSCSRVATPMAYSFAPALVSPLSRAGSVASGRR